MRAEFSLDYDVLTLERSHKVYLMARFVAGRAPQATQRRPLNISLVIDRSGSMAGSKMDYTRQAAQFLVQHLSAVDVFSVVVYSDTVETIIPPSPVVNKDAMTQRISAIRSMGTTNLSAGWLEGCQNVMRHHQADTLNRVIIMSDGLANRGITDVAQLVALARQKHEEGVSTTTMGLGKDFNEDLLMAMADAGGGAFYFIESPEVAPDIFQEELRGLLSVVGQNLKVSLLPTVEVTAVRQLNAYPMSSEGTGASFRLGDIFAEEVKTLLLELNIPALKTLGTQRIATLRFEYDEITEGGTTHQSLEMPVMVNVKTGELPAPAQDVVKAVLLLQAANARQEAVQSADQGDFLSASQALRRVADDIVASGVADDKLSEERQALLQQAERLEKGREGYDGYSRKTMSTQAYYTQINRHENTVALRMREAARGKNVADANRITSDGEHPVVVPPPPVPDEIVPYQPNVTPTHVSWRGRVFPLIGDVIRLGRAKHNEIVIDEHGVSRFHAQLRREGDGLVVEDLGSTNGTMVGGQRLQAPYRLSVGDVVYLCDEKLIFRLEKTDLTDTNKKE
jgi:Ca-activated chloride channel family protein